MKKQLIHIFLMGIILGACDQMETPGVKEEIDPNNFIVYLSDVQTKTVNDGMSTRWVEGDNIHLFHASTGTKNYINDLYFTCDNLAANKFSGSLSEELDANANYDWYAFYPGISTINRETPAKFSKYIGRTGMSSFAGKVTQAGNNSMAHLAVGRNGFPVVGFVNNVSASEFPTIPMKNVASVICVNVTNTLSEPIAIRSVDLVMPKPIIGKFTIELTGNDIAADCRDGQKIVRLEVAESSPIAGGESAKFYIGVAPFNVTSGEGMLLYLNASIGDKTVSQRIEKVFDGEIAFKSGFIKTFNVSYSQADVKPLQVNKSDFQTLNLGEIQPVYKRNSHYESFDGWKLLHGAVLPVTTLNLGEQPDGNLIAGITGDTKAHGVMTSPLIAGGCKTLTFQYGIDNNNHKIKFLINIKDADGNVKYTETVSDDAPEIKKPYTYTFPNATSGEIQIDGTFQLEITNLGPSGKTGFLADGLAICNVEWTNVN